jgi:hypothetical protein
MDHLGHAPPRDGGGFRRRAESMDQRDRTLPPQGGRLCKTASLSGPDLALVLAGVGPRPARPPQQTWRRRRTFCSL